MWKIINIFIHFFGLKKNWFTLKGQSSENLVSFFDIYGQARPEQEPLLVLQFLEFMKKKLLEAAHFQALAYPYM